MDASRLSGRGDGQRGALRMDDQRAEGLTASQAAGPGGITSGCGGLLASQWFEARAAELQARRSLRRGR